MFSLWNRQTWKLVDRSFSLFNLEDKLLLGKWVLSWLLSISFHLLRVRWTRLFNIIDRLTEAKLMMSFWESWLDWDDTLLRLFLHNFLWVLHLSFLHVFFPCTFSFLTLLLRQGFGNIEREVMDSLSSFGLSALSLSNYLINSPSHDILLRGFLWLERFWIEDLLGIQTKLWRTAQLFRKGRRCKVLLLF